MGLIGKIAFRNVLRNPRRTGLTVTLITFGLMTLIFYDGLVTGMLEAMIRSTTGTFMGEAQIHQAGYRKDPDIEKSVKNWPEIRTTLTQDPRVKAFAPRVIANSMLSSAHNVAGVTLYGIDLELEPKVSKLKQAVREGEFLKGEKNTEILIGKKLAKLLEVELGDRLVLTTAQAKTGELSQELFRVSGILEFNSRAMDQGMAFVEIHRAQELIALSKEASETTVHEVAIQFNNSFNDSNHALDTSMDLWEKLRSPGNDAQSWKELVPAIGAMVDMSRFATLLTGLILFGMISFGIINSLFMSVYERMYEFGVMKSIGTRPFQIAALILAEAFALGILGLGAGILLGGGISGYFSVHGIDFSGVEYSGASLNEPIRTVLKWSQFIGIPLYVLFLTVLAGVYPAIHAARIVPIKAMRRSL